jgi:nitrite reductase/ring-hydroxylating ferredoxin subunit
MSEVATGPKANAAVNVAEREPGPPPSPWLRAVAKIEAIPGLDKATDVYGKVTAPFTASKPVADVLNGRLLGHALHPVLSDLPIGFWSAVPLLDLAGEDSAAQLLTGAGILAGVATAVTGSADWATTYGRDRRLGLVHGLTNGAGMAAQMLAWNARRRGKRATGCLLSLTGLGIAAAAAYLGGELVFGRGWIVDHTAHLSGPSDWTGVADDSAIVEGKATAVDVDGRKVLLSRVRGQICALENTCAHAGGPLDEGSIEDGVVTCPWHQSQFRLEDGACVAGPSTFPQPVLSTRVRDGRVEIKGEEH